jgi:hypothetical protein
MGTTFGDWRTKDITNPDTTKNLSPASFETKEEYQKYVNEVLGGDMTTAGEKWDEVKSAGTEEQLGAAGSGAGSFPYIYPGGSDISTELYTFGRALGAEKGSQGRGLTAVAAGGAALLDIGRNVAAGIGYEKRNQFVEDYYRKKQQEQNYTPNPQNTNMNTTGGMYEEGGTVDEALPNLDAPVNAEEEEEIDPMFVTKNGGKFDRQVGDTITFKYQGKTMTKVIKDIKPNGKIVV